MFKRLRLILIIGLLTIPVMTAFGQQNAQPVTIGDTINGTLNAANPSRAYQFAATSEQAITITLTSDEFDPYLTLLDSDGRTLATDDDSAGSLDSRISAFAIPANGLYTVIAQSYDASRGARLSQDDYGAFTLEITEATVQQIEYGMSIEGELTASSLSEYYTFRGDAGDTVLISLTAVGDRWDPYLYLYEGMDTSFALVSNDDGAGNLNSLIGPFTLPEDGLYTIEATSFGRDDTGTFRLMLERAEVIGLEYGESIEGTLSESRSYLYYQFQGTSGDIVDILVEGGAAVGTTLIVNSPEGYQLSYSDSYSGSDPLITAFQIPATGVYTIVVRTTDPSAAGKVTVSIEETVLQSLDDGPLTLSFSTSITRNTVAFTGNRGETITLSAVRANAPSSSLNISVTQDGTTLTYISASSVRDISATFDVPANGIVLVQVDEYSYSNSEVELSITRAE